MFFPQNLDTYSKIIKPKGNFKLNGRSLDYSNIITITLNKKIYKNKNIKNLKNQIKIFFPPKFLNVIRIKYSLFTF